MVVLTNTVYAGCGGRREKVMVEVKSLTLELSHNCTGVIVVVVVVVRRMRMVIVPNAMRVGCGGGREREVVEQWWTVVKKKACGRGVHHPLSLLQHCAFCGAYLWHYLSASESERVPDVD